VRVAAVVVDGVEDVVRELELLDVDVATLAEPVTPSRRPEVELMMVPRPLPSSARMGFRSMELRVSFCC
jgi:hypothetical protein